MSPLDAVLKFGDDVAYKSDAPMVGYVANAIMTRTVKPDLQLLAGHLMQTIAQESGAATSPYPRNKPSC